MQSLLLRLILWWRTEQIQQLVQAQTTTGRIYTTAEGHRSELPFAVLHQQDVELQSLVRDELVDVHVPLLSYAMRVIKRLFL